MDEIQFKAQLLQILLKYWELDANKRSRDLCREITDLVRSTGALTRKEPMGPPKDAS